jgi:hypothetical protein
MLCITLRGCLYHIVLNVHAPTKDKSDDIKDSFYKELEYVFDQVLMYHVKMLLEDFSAKIGIEDIFKLTIVNESLHEINDDNGVRVVNFVTSKLFLKSTVFLHCSIRKCTSYDRKMHSHIDHVLVDTRWYSSIIDLLEDDCDTDHYLVIGEVREILLVSEQAAQEFDMGIYNLKNLKDLEVNEQYQFKISGRLSALENFDDIMHISRAWEGIRQNIKPSAT